MMHGDHSPRSNPTVQIPPHWDPLFSLDDPTASSAVHSPFSPSEYSPLSEGFGSLQRFLPSNDSDDSFDSHSADAFSCDHFRMFEFKVRRCARARSHDWTECPFAHPGEKARRRDPRRHHYSATPCAEFRKAGGSGGGGGGGCKRGDACEFAHGVFECWLHPARYRTQPCKDGLACRRRVCFFAHTPSQLRVLSPTGSASPPALESPPESPQYSPRELAASMRGLQIGMSSSPPVSWTFGSPRAGSGLRPGFCSVPTTPTRRDGPLWDRSSEEEPAMERVESGRNLRAIMYAKLSKENSLGRVDSSGSGAPDVGWISELVK